MVTIGAGSGELGGKMGAMSSRESKKPPKPLELVAEFERIVYDWDPKKEAEFFFHLILLGVVSPEKAEEDLLMTERQKNWLMRTFPREDWIIERIFFLRQDTLKALQYLMVHPEAATKRPFPHQKRRQQSRIRAEQRSWGGFFQ
jgi:hypothetical protein